MAPFMVFSEFEQTFAHVFQTVHSKEMCFGITCVDVPSIPSCTSSYAHTAVYNLTCEIVSLFLTDGLINLVEVT